MMRYLLLLLFSCMAMITFGQADKAKTEARVRWIRQEYARINSGLKSFRIQHEDIDGQSSEGGSATKYVDKDSLKKAVVVFYGEMGKSTRTYYFSGGQLIFLLESTVTYTQPAYLGKLQIASTEEDRCYFNGTTLIRWLKGKASVSDGKALAQKAADIRQELRDFLHL